jgi:hypothetical protein
LSAAVFKGAIFVMGGSFNDDPSIIGGPPARVYFNDVWRTRDGVEWELVTAAADWASRPGHQCLVLNNHFVLFGGFGLSPDPDNPFLPSNPMDVWVSKDGAEWSQVSDSPWNATEPADIKYDFDALVASGGGGGQRPAIFTFGGDRETFDFFDPVNHLRVDDDVWRFAPSTAKNGSEEGNTAIAMVKGLRAEPNPFNPRTAIKFTLVQDAVVRLSIYDLSGRLVRSLIPGTFLETGAHEAIWGGLDRSGVPASAGVYFYRLEAGDFSASQRMVLLK